MTIQNLTIAPVLPRTINEAFDVFTRRGYRTLSPAFLVYNLTHANLELCARNLTKKQYIARARAIIQAEFDAEPNGSLTRQLMAAKI